MKTLKWSNLKKNLCPSCDKEIAGYHFHPGNIVKHPCGFVISVKKFSSIVNSQITADLESKWSKEQEEQNER